jgi:hypothetical protein
MNLDELLASLSKSAGLTEKARVLVKATDFVPKGLDTARFEQGGLKILGCMIYWLATRDHLSIQKAQALGGKVALLKSDPEAISLVSEQVFEKQVSVDDVTEEVQEFCQKYCIPAEGSLSSDFHDVFVEGTNLPSFCEVQLSPGKLEEFAKLIDTRFTLYEQRSNDWNRFIVPMDAFDVDEKSYASAEEWVSDIRSLSDLESTPSGMYKTRLHEYWGTVDAALQWPIFPVANELIRTYLWNSDSSSQSSVWRVLRSFPPVLVVDAIVANIEEIASQTDWASTLVDFGNSDCEESVLRELAHRLDLADQSARIRYVNALEVAERNGSVFARRLLNTLYPHD